MDLPPGVHVAEIGIVDARAAGEERDEEATDALEAKLSRCPASDQRDQARRAIDHAKQIAEQFVKDFGRLEVLETLKRPYRKSCLGR